MIQYLIRALFGSKNERYMKRQKPAVEAINAMEPTMQALRDEELPLRLAALREEHQNGRSLDDMLPEVFACHRRQEALHVARQVRQ